MTDGLGDHDRSNRNAAIVLVVVIGVVLFAGVATINLAWRYLRSRPAAPRAEPTPPSVTVRTEETQASPTARSESTATAVAGGALAPASRAEWWRYQEATADEPRYSLPREMDRTEIDPQTLFVPARRLARLLEPEAELSNDEAFSTRMPVRGGTVDLSNEGGLVFEYRYPLSPEQAASRGTTFGAIVVRVEWTAMTASRAFPAGPIRPTRAAPPDPSCPAKRAWSLAVASGVPKDAVASLQYHDVSHNGAGPFVWSFGVDDHPELHRDIDGQSCELVK